VQKTKLKPADGPAQSSDGFQRQVDVVVDEVELDNIAMVPMFVCHVLVNAGVRVVNLYEHDMQTDDYLTVHLDRA
jgi:hypothetical protein